MHKSLFQHVCTATIVARGIVLDLSLYLHPHIMCARREGSDKTAWQSVGLSEFFFCSLSV